MHKKAILGVCAVVAALATAVFVINKVSEEKVYSINDLPNAEK